MAVTTRIATAAPAVEGATELVRITPSAGFIDEAIAVDKDRAAYVVSDGAGQTRLHLQPLVGDPVSVMVLDLGTTVPQPQSLHLIGSRVVVLGTSPDGTQVGAIVVLPTKAKPKPPVTRLGPAKHVSLITRDGKPRIALHRESLVAKTGATRHEVELLAIETARRVGSVRALELVDGTHKTQEFRVNHWSDGWTRAHGIKGGEYSKKEDHRTPDVEATFDVVAGKLVDKRPITDLHEQRRRFQALATADGRLDYVRLNWDQSGLMLVRSGKLAPFALDQPYTQYLRETLQSVVTPKETWVALKVDKVNPAAVARKKADPEYLDVFVAAAPDAGAVRTARIPAANLRHKFGVATNAPGTFWLLERDAAMDRGGKTLTVYRTP